MVTHDNNYFQVEEHNGSNNDNYIEADGHKGN